MTPEMFEEERRKRVDEQQRQGPRMLVAAFVLSGVVMVGVIWLLAEFGLIR